MLFETMLRSLNVIFTRNVEEQQVLGGFFWLIILSLQSLRVERKIKRPDLLHSCCFSFVCARM